MSIGILCGLIVNMYNTLIYKINILAALINRPVGFFIYQSYFIDWNPFISMAGENFPMRSDTLGPADRPDMSRCFTGPTFAISAVPPDAPLSPATPRFGHAGSDSPETAVKEVHSTGPNR